MKKILFLLVVFIYILFSCATDILYQRHQAFFPRLFNSATKQISVDDGSRRIHAEISGQVRFNEKENAIQSISKNGYLKYESDDTLLCAKPSPTGILYYLEIDGDEQPLSHFSRNYVASTIQQMILWGIDTESHMERVYRKEGPETLLQEIPFLKTDQLKAVYFQYLLDRSKFSSEEIEHVIQTLVDNIGAHELRLSVIKKLLRLYPPDNVTELTYISAISGLQDGTGKTSLIEKLISHNSLSEQGHLVLIQTISSMSSASLKFNLYKAWTEQQIPFQSAWHLLMQHSANEQDHPAKRLLFQAIGKNKPAGPALDSIFTDLSVNINFNK